MRLSGFSPIPQKITPEYLSMQTDLLTQAGLTVTSIGKTVQGRDIPAFRWGRGEKNLLYVGGHHAMEWMTAVILFRFAQALCMGGRQEYGLDLLYLQKSRTLWILPLLNVDGAILHGTGDEKYAKWQANANGVDLNHNYDAGFADYKIMEKALGIIGPGPTRFAGPAPESEPESRALAEFVRQTNPHLLLTLHTQGEEIFSPPPKGKEATWKRMLASVAALSGYHVSVPEGSAAYGGLADYAAATLGIPSFTLECGKGENPLPPMLAGELFLRLRRLLFSAMIL